MQLLKFMTSGKGRLGRIILGLVVASIGLFVVGGWAGTLLTVVALVPISGGLFDFCLMGRALGYPINGRAARQQLSGK